MKFAVNTKDISNALKKCALAQTARGTLPILSCLKIEADKDGLTITGTDLDRVMICKVPAEVEKTGAICLASRTLIAIMAGSGNADVEADAKHKVRISIGSSRFNLSGLAAKEFPENRIKPSAESFRIASDEVSRSFGAVKWAASTDESRFVINGVFVGMDDDRMTFAATNGSFLSRTWVEFTGAFDSEMIIPSASIPLIEEIASDGDEVVFSRSSDGLKAECGTSVVITKMIEGNYPNYRQVCPSKHDFKSHATVKCEDLAEAMDRTSIVIKDRYQGSTFEFSDGKITVTAKMEDSASCEISAETEGPPINIMWRSSALRMPLRTWGSESVKIAMIDEMSPSSITNGRNEFVLMPMRQV